MRIRKEREAGRPGQPSALVDQPSASLGAKKPMVAARRGAPTPAVRTAAKPVVVEEVAQIPLPPSPVASVHPVTSKPVCADPVEAETEEVEAAPDEAESMPIEDDALTTGSNEDLDDVAADVLIATEVAKVEPTEPEATEAVVEAMPAHAEAEEAEVADKDEDDASSVASKGEDPLLVSAQVVTIEVPLNDAQDTSLPSPFLRPSYASVSSATPLRRSLSPSRTPASAFVVGAAGEEDESMADDSAADETLEAATEDDSDLAVAVSLSPSAVRNPLPFPTALSRTIIRSPPFSSFPSPPMAAPAFFAPLPSTSAFPSAFLPRPFAHASSGSEDDSSHFEAAPFYAEQSLIASQRFPDLSATPSPPAAPAMTFSAAKALFTSTAAPDTMATKFAAHVHRSPRAPLSPLLGNGVPAKL
jgi:hypothetical protein